MYRQTPGGTEKPLHASKSLDAALAVPIERCVPNGPGVLLRRTQ
jgi:hypothetical protein